MAKKIQLTIAEPCHESWENMSPAGKGKFCGSCRKQVVDFSYMSDRQVAEFFKKPSTGSVCGRFMTDQLDRAIEIPRKRIPFLKYFFQIAIPAFLVSIKSSAQTSKGKIKVETVATDTAKKPPVYQKMGLVAMPRKPIVDTTTPIKDPVIFLKGEIEVKQPGKMPECIQPIMGGISYVEPEKINKKEIEGKVVDQDGQPIAFANIETAKNRKAIMTDENGLFTINRNWLSKEDKLFISSAGYKSDTMKVGKSDYMTGELYVQLNANVVLPEVVISSMGIVKRSTLLGVLGLVNVETISVMDQKDLVIAKDSKLPADENSLFIYPNPVVAGRSVNISFKNPEEGYYQLRLVNQAGQMVRQRELWIDTEARLMNTEIPAVAAGSYFMVLTNKKTGKKYTEKIIIQ